MRLKTMAWKTTIIYCKKYHPFDVYGTLSKNATYISFKKDL